MSKVLIEQRPTFDKKVEGTNKLAIAEMFSDTIQGEGVNAGIPATFIRLQGCTLTCVWCDTLDVWPHGNEYSFDEVLNLLNHDNNIQKYMNGAQHLILTGGSPLKQQDRLAEFIYEFYKRFGFYPYIEVENEAVLKPKPKFSQYVSCWNNSPKLANSMMKERARLKPEIIKEMAALDNSWFKFVVDKEADWEEIKRDYLPHISLGQVILMPEGQTQEQLTKTRELTAAIAIRENVRFSDRLHITLWNKKTGV